MKSVIVVGPDHQNTLGVIRAVGKEGYMVNLIIYGGDNIDCKCKKSRFLTGRYMHCAEEKDAVIQCVMDFADENDKMPIIPTADFAAMCVDTNYNSLCEHFFLPSINGIEGKIYEYMDKYTQKEIAERFGLKMARTEKINLPLIQEVNFVYPTVLKPVVSANGMKADIVFVHNKTELYEKMDEYTQKGYQEVLVQEFIKKDYEVCIFGCLTLHSKMFYCGALKKMRYSPVGDGASLSFAKFIPVDTRFLKITNVLKEIGYNGLFDIEVFVVGDELYLNEINFRNSGNAWSVVNRGINIPVIWIKDQLGEPVEIVENYINDGSYFMNETADFRNVLKRNVGFLHWLKDLMNTRSFNKFWSKDIIGSLAWYRR